MIKIFHVFLFGLLLYFNLYSQSLSVLQQNPKELVLEYKIDLKNITNDENISIDKLIRLLQLNQLVVTDSVSTFPLISELIALPTEQINIQILENKTEYIPFKSFDAGAQKILNRWKAEISLRQRLTDAPVHVVPLGFNGEVRIGAVNINPLQFGDDVISIYKYLRFSIGFNYDRSKYSDLSKRGRNIPVLNPEHALIENDKMTTFRMNAGHTDKSAVGFYGNAFRIYTKEAGIYKITYADLREAEIIPEDIQLNSIKMLNKGLQVPFLMIGEEDGRFDEDDYIEFWADEIINENYIEGETNLYRHPFTGENVYIFVWGQGNGIRIIEESAAIQEELPQNYNRSLYFKDKIHWEKDAAHLKMGYFKVNEYGYKYDNWFADAGISAVGRKSYDIALTYPDSFSFEPINVKVMLHGQADGAVHNVMAWLNNNQINEVTGSNDFKGENFYLMASNPQNPVYSSQLRNGVNSLDIQVFMPVSGGNTDKVALNWVEVEYNRQYKAKNNYLEFNKPDFIPYPNIDLFQFDLKNFDYTDIQIYKKGVSKLTGFQLNPVEVDGGIKYNIRFQDNIISDDVEYVALREQHKKRAQRIEFMQPYDPLSINSDLLSSSNSADYLLITSTELYPRALELASLMETNGQTVALVEVQSIYDQFNHSIKSPLAIKSFLKYVYFNWDQNVKLNYVSFLGDATYDYRGDRYPNADVVPTYFYQSPEFGAIPTDYPYSLLVGDDLIPDVAIGRIPVAFNSELIRYIEKVEYFVNSNSGDWVNKSLFISGNDKSTWEYGDHNYPAFRSQNQRTIDVSMPLSYTTYKLNAVKDDSLEFDPNYGKKTDLIDYFDEGVSFVSFMGHGGGGVWSDEGLMEVRDIYLLNNEGRFPFVSSLTCFTGAFENPGHSSLGDAMLLESDKGCIAFLGSAGLGWLHNDYALGLRLPHYLLSQNMTFGQAVNYTKIFYLATNDYYGPDDLYGILGYGILKNVMVHQYNLIGDPALIFEIPENTLNIHLAEKYLEVNDTAHFVVKTPVLTGQGYFEVADDKNDPKIQIPFYYSGDSTIIEVVIPETLEGRNGIFRAYLSDGSVSTSGYCRFAINAPFLTSINTLPSEPMPGSTFNFKLSVSDIDSIDHIDIRHNSETGPKTYATWMDNDYFISDSIHLGNNELNFYYSVYLYLNNGEIRKYINNLLSFEDIRPDFAIDITKLKLEPYGENLALEFPVYNFGNTGLDSANVKMFIGRGNYSAGISVIDSLVKISGNDSIIIHSPNEQLTALDNEKLFINVSSLGVVDRNIINNSDSVDFQLNAVFVMQDLGITMDKLHPDTIQLDEWGEITIDGSLINKDGFLKFEKKNIIGQLQNLTSIQTVRLNNTDSPMGVEISSAAFEPDSIIRVTFFYDPDDLAENGLSGGDLNGYKWNSRISQWEGVESIVDTINNKVQVNAAQNGIFTLMHSGDSNPPVIEFTVDGRPLESKSLVSSKPNISIYIEDENGIKVERPFVQVLLNDQPVPANAIFIPDSLNNPGNLGIKVYPQLDPGNHVLTVKVQDVNHNISQKTVSMIVTDEFNLHVFGNYPNPFSDQTIISYFIENGEPIDDLEIKIYTVSGRLIKKIDNDINTINNPLYVVGIGYHELIWDGTDDDGNQVANGVYFAMVRAKYQGKTKNKILKVARIR